MLIRRKRPERKRKVHLHLTDYERLCLGALGAYFDLSLEQVLRHMIIEAHEELPQKARVSSDERLKPFGKGDKRVLNKPSSAKKPTAAQAAVPAAPPRPPTPEAEAVVAVAPLPPSAPNVVSTEDSAPEPEEMTSDDTTSFGLGPLVCARCAGERAATATKLGALFSKDELSVAAGLRCSRCGAPQPPGELLANVTFDDADEASAAGENALSSV